MDSGNALSKRDSGVQQDRGKSYFDQSQGQIKVDALNGLRVRVRDEGEAGEIQYVYIQPSTRKAVAGVNMDTGGLRVFPYTYLEFEDPQLGERLLLAALP